MKIADFLTAGCEVTILIADLHAYLDNKSTYEQLLPRSTYYRKIIEAVLKQMQAPTAKLKFVNGSSYQLSEKYNLDFHTLNRLVTKRNAVKAGSEVVKQDENPCISSLYYPCMQALDEEYLAVDIQLGGVDQTKIFAFAEKYLPMMNYKKRIHLLNFMLPSLAGKKMSASDEQFKIDILETEEELRKKIYKSFCPPGNVDNNLPMYLIKYVLPKPFSLRIRDDLILEDAVEVEQHFIAFRISPIELKDALITALNATLEPIRKQFANSESMQLIRDAYD